MKSNAPEELKVALDNGRLCLNDLLNHPDWVEWLYGQENYVRDNCKLDVEMFDWLSLEKKDIPVVVENYLVLLFEKRLIAEMKQDWYSNFEEVAKEHISEGLFRERNSDLFFDDLPFINMPVYRKLRVAIEDRILSMKMVFSLSEEEKELLKGKDMSMCFDTYMYQNLFAVLGSRIEDFELYKKYRGIIDIVADAIGYRPSLESIEEKEDLIKQVFLANVGMRASYRYSTAVPDEFKEEHPEFFLDINAPSKLKDIFYNSGTNIIGEDTLSFKELKKHPEYIPFLKGKDIRHCMDWSNEYDDYFNFCGNQDLAMELGLKYGDYVSKLNLYDEKGEDKEAIIAEKIHHAIIYQTYLYNEDMTEYFKNKYPELFLDEEAPKVLKERFYSKKSPRVTYLYSDNESLGLNFEFIKDNPEFLPYLKGKDLRGIVTPNYRKVLEICDDNTERFLALGIEYGDVLVHPQLKYRMGSLAWELKNTELDNEVLIESLDKLIGEAIKSKDLLAYDDSLPLHLQYKYQEEFLLPEELERIRNYIDKWEKDEAVESIKKKFYSRCISFKDLYSNDALKEIIKHKDIDRCMDFYRAGEFFREFSKVLGGNFDKAYNIAIDRYSNQLSSILYGHIASENIDSVIEFYKQTKFIPNPAVFNKLPPEKLKGFALNKNLWAELMKIDEYSSNDDYIGSLLELAVIMGVFETREFKKNGKVMLQGAGEEGFEKLQELINYVPEFVGIFSISPEDIEDASYIFAMRGYSKFDGSYMDALRDRRVKMAFQKAGLLDELKENTLTDYDMESVLNSYIQEEEIETFFSKDEEGKYHYILDKDSNKKVQMLLKTIGIKKDNWLRQEEFDLIKACNRDFVAKAFIQEGEGYRFNISKQGEDYVIGKDVEITEEQSRRNKKLFDYVRFLMQEYSMEEEALCLAANNDRSNIDLLLNSDKMEILLNKADWVSQRACDRYEECDFYKLNPDSKKDYKFFSGDKLHQIFEGLKLEYSKGFRDFILENKYALIHDWELLGFMKEFQQKFKELSQDPDYANIKLTPEILIKALTTNENQYSNRKVGFEKGEELASKFSFSQEYYDQAQMIWSEARKREVSSIPRVEGKQDDFSYEVLRLDNPEGIFIGELTNCCQRLGGAGETSMLHSMTEKNGRVFVVRNEDKRIIAQAWLWRNGNTICFDNVEIPANSKSAKNEELIYKILQKVSKELCDKDSEELNKLVALGKLSQEKADQLKAMKVTVGKGHNDIGRIVYNNDSDIEDKEIKRPVESGKAYKGICRRDRLYILDSNHQVILYQAENYVSHDSMLAIHHDENIELSYDEMKYKELKTITSIIKEVEGECNFETREGLLKQYDAMEEEIKLVRGTDWFMLYSENADEIKVHKMLKSPSSGILKKSVKEQREAVKILMDKGKTISMEFENDRVHKAAKSMIRHMQKRYTMRVAEEGERIRVSEIQMR